MANGIAKRSSVAVRGNGNNVRRMAMTVDRVIDVPGVVRVVCGRGESAEDMERLMASAHEANGRVGRHCAVGCFRSDVPLTDDQVAAIAAQMGAAQVLQKRFLGGGRMVALEGNRRNALGGGDVIEAEIIG